MIFMLRWSHLPVLALIAAVLIGQTAEAAPAYPKHETPIPPATMTLMKGNNTAPAEPMLIRIYKKEAELEVWKRSTSGRYIRLKTFPICRWSGQLGPSRRRATGRLRKASMP